MKNLRTKDYIKIAILVIICMYLFRRQLSYYMDFEAFKAKVKARNKKTVTIPPQDCIGNWQKCSSPCFIQSYMITTDAKNGGAECPYKQGDSRPCRMGECPAGTNVNPDLYNINPDGTRK